MSAITTFNILKKAFLSMDITIITRVTPTHKKDAILKGFTDELVTVEDEG